MKIISNDKFHSTIYTNHLKIIQTTLNEIIFLHLKKVLNALKIFLSLNKILKEISGEYFSENEPFQLVEDTNHNSISHLNNSYNQNHLENQDFELFDQVNSVNNNSIKKKDASIIFNLNQEQINSLNKQSEIMKTMQSLFQANEELKKFLNLYKENLFKSRRLFTSLRRTIIQNQWSQFVATTCAIIDFNKLKEKKKSIKKTKKNSTNSSNISNMSNLSNQSESNQNKDFSTNMNEKQIPLRRRPPSIKLPSSLLSPKKNQSSPSTPPSPSSYSSHSSPSIKSPTSSPSNKSITSPSSISNPSSPSRKSNPSSPTSLFSQSITKRTRSKSTFSDSSIGKKKILSKLDKESCSVLKFDPEIQELSNAFMLENSISRHTITYNDLIQTNEQLHQDLLSIWDLIHLIYTSLNTKEAVWIYNTWWIVLQRSQQVFVDSNLKVYHETLKLWEKEMISTGFVSI